jgi:predicted DNA-binding transcriptional regulator AlpA
MSNVEDQAKAKIKAARAGAVPQQPLSANHQHQAPVAFAPDHTPDQRARERTLCAAPCVRLMAKSEVLAIVGCTYTTLWQMMRRGVFPRSRIVGGKSMWLSTEVEAWLVALPVRKLKGDRHRASEDHHHCVNKAKPPAKRLGSFREGRRKER